MPNWVTNVIEFHCTEDRMKEIGNFLKGNIGEDFGDVDFNAVIPIPKSLNIECSSIGDDSYHVYFAFIDEIENNNYSPADFNECERRYKSQLGNDSSKWELGKQYYDNMFNYGATTWYSWSVKHWGTKWNACDCVPTTPESKQLMFLTAWSNVMLIVNAISHIFPDVTIYYGWADENYGYNVGAVVIKDGKRLSTMVPDEGSIEARNLADNIYCHDINSWLFSDTLIECGYVKI